MPDLTDLANVKTSLEITSSGLDAIINLLIPEVTALAQTYTHRTLVETDDVTLKTQANGAGAKMLLVEYPIRAVTSLHVSCDLPRVYGADELLVEDTDYFHDDERGIIERVDGGTFPTDPQSVQLVYDLGYADGSIPADLERAAIEIISTKLYKGKANLYHITSELVGEHGEIRNIRFDDIPQTAREILDRYTDRRHG